jgi:hypothetical protein
MNSKRIKVWLLNIYNTQDQEISCSECFDQVSRYVELEVSGEDVLSQLPKVKHHIDQCLVCRQEYETLRDLRRLEEQDEPPSLDDLIDKLP